MMLIGHSCVLVQMSPDDLAALPHFRLQALTDMWLKINVVSVWLRCCHWQSGCHGKLLRQ